MKRARVSCGGSVILRANGDWLRISTSRKSFCRSDTQTLFFSGEDLDSRKYVCVRRLLLTLPRMFTYKLLLLPNYVFYSKCKAIKT